MNDFTPEDPKPLAVVRDYLAMERTAMANERTLLAYIRTGMIFLGGGATFIKFFPDDRAMSIIGWCLVAAFVPVVAFGAYRFLALRKRLAAKYPKEDEDSKDSLRIS